MNLLRCTLYTARSSHNAHVRLQDMDELYMDLYVFDTTVSSFEVFFLVGKTKCIYIYYYVLLFKTQDSLHKFCYNLRFYLDPP